MSSLPMLGTPDVFSDDARSPSMSTQEKLVSVNDDEKRNVQLVWYDIATARLEPVDTLSEAFASTLRGSLINGHLCVAEMSSQSWPTLEECSWSQRLPGGVHHDLHQ